LKLIVTGGAGFIGSHLVEALIARGDEVMIIDSFDDFYDPAIKRHNLSSVLASGKAELIEADISDEASIHSALAERRFDAILNFAARAGVRPSLERPRDYLRTNVEGTLTMLDVARERGIRAFVQASSSSVYGDSTEVPFRESATADFPISPYAASKRSAELLCHTYAHLYGLSVACLRLFTAYGPRQRPDLMIHKFTKLMVEGREIPVFGDGSTGRDYTYVDDIVAGVQSALAWTLRSPAGSFEIINLGGGATTSLASIIELLSAKLGIEPRVAWLPPQPGDVTQTFADLEKARSLLQYKPRISIEEGISRFARWFRDQQAS
jgi:UDP-glucuronate 4-epimerase